MNSTWTYPAFLWLLLLLPIIVVGYMQFKNEQYPTLKISQWVSKPELISWKARLRPYLFVLRMLALAGLIVALARPRSAEKSNFSSFKNGIDIVIASDVSGSMMATDLKPNRLEAVKNVAANFIKNRPNDRIGLVVYAGESYTRTPVTSDKLMVLQSLAEVQYNGFALQDGTAIGLGLATAINRLKESPTKSKVIILLTDGVNNAGSLDPITAAEIAKEYGIKVYTIGVGTNGIANFPIAKDAAGNLVFQPQKVEIDESLMKQIAAITKGKYFRANSNEKLEAIYKEIDALEKSIIKEEKHIQFDENYRPWVLVALFFLLAEFVLNRTVFKSFI